MRTLKFLGLIPWHRLEDLMGDLEAKGLSDDEVRENVVAALDALIPAHLLPPPWGSIAEALDGPGVRLALQLALKARQGKAKRQARRAAREAAKQAE
jgi:hypothetical protein